MDTRRALLALLGERVPIGTDAMALQVIRLWRSAMTAARDGAARFGPKGSTGAIIGVALVSAGLQAASLTMTGRTGAVVGNGSEDTLEEARRTLEEARTLVAAVYQNTGLIDAMKASAERLRLDHDQRRPDGR